MSGFEYACFISYKHPPEIDGVAALTHFWMEFIEKLEQKLKEHLTIELGIYRDHKLKQTPGIHYPQALSESLCKSACLIAILVPQYQESSWCVAEWEAMEQLAKKRLAKDDPSALIIPILFRGDKTKAQKFAGTRDVIDFSHIQKPSTQLNTIASRKTIESMAKRIAKFAKTLEVDSNCKTFTINVGPETSKPGFDDPDPLA